jgi:hypothetical protein
LIRGWRIRDALPWYFALHLVVLPTLRMLPTPGHDGVRLFLPTFFFLAAFAGWGALAIADGLRKRSRTLRAIVAALVLGPAAWQLWAIHPFELSYYNELIGGPRGAWTRGFELSYWYEAFDGETLADLNRVLPPGARVDFLERKLINTPSLDCLQELGGLRSDVVLDLPEDGTLPYCWMLTHDSKATPRTRLLYALTPFYARRPRQLDGLRVVTVAAPATVARAWALDALTRGLGKSDPPRAPGWVRGSPWLRWLGRFWGEGVTKGPPRGVDDAAFAWARSDPDGLRAAARSIAAGGPIEPGSAAARLRAFLDRRLGDNTDNWEEERLDWRTLYLLRTDPQALVEAVEILIKRPDAVRTVLLQAGYTDEAAIGGFLDRDVLSTDHHP